ncbi:hypothetical protein DDQ41_24730 [Streptomyces spongiicola]|uniref:Transposase n=1 Tax=Streptomyces spongiicola TaxID=1690221 RepID=A0ABM6VBB8_9ACTN|nr:hypothetical protein DDQ41_24730 [Streptomyces spongiicola]
MSKKSNTSKRYTAEFKRDAVALALSSEKTVTEVARDPGVSPEGLRRFLRSAPAGCCGIGCVRRGAGSAARSGCIAHGALGRNRHTSLWYIR